MSYILHVSMDRHGYPSAQMCLMVVLLVDIERVCMDGYMYTCMCIGEVPLCGARTVEPAPGSVFPVLHQRFQHPL